MKRLLLVLGAAALVSACGPMTGMGDPILEESTGASSVIHASTADGRYLLVATGAGTEVWDTLAQSATVLSLNPASALYASISPDGKRVAFKDFLSGGLSQPVVTDLETMDKTPLSEPAPEAGTPIFLQNGAIAYTVGDELRYGSGQTVGLGFFADQLAVSPDGANLAAADPAGALVMVDLEKGLVSRVEHGWGYLWFPVFSPGGRVVVLRGMDSSLYRADLDAGTVERLREGRLSRLEGVRFITDSDIEVLEETIGEGVNSLVLSHLSLAGEIVSETVLEETPASFSPQTAPTYHLTSTGRVVGGPAGGARAVSGGSFPRRVASGLVAPSPRSIAAPGTSGYTIIDSVPYINQMDDALDVFNGDAACNTTSALMLLAYYNILPPRQDVVGGYYSGRHSSPYGFYQSQVYTYGRTFDVGSYDNDGYWARGGYGYITQQNWIDTKGYMASFLGYHGLESSVDWNPSMAKARQEIDQGHPFVALVLLGTPSGHYITARGYHKTQNSLVFNDPWGAGTPWSFMCNNGTNVVYDWPGYNYGNRNLGTVYCFVYGRGSLESDFEQVEGALTEVAAGGGKVWGVNAAGNVYERDQRGWNQIYGTLARLTIDSDGTVWGINPAGNIYFMEAGQWHHVPGSLSDIGANAGEVYGVNAQGNIYHYLGEGQWAQVPASFSAVAVDVGDDGLPWFAAADGRIFSLSAQGQWVQVAGSLTDIAFGGGHVWGVNGAGSIYRYEGDGVWTQLKAPFRASRLDVGADGIAWVTATDGRIFRTLEP